MKSAPAIFLFCFAFGCVAESSARTVAKNGPIEHVIVVSIDGLRPVSYTAPDADGLKVPTLRKIVAEGVHARGVDSVFPSVTYPSHTTMVTGMHPARHGIATNLAWDPLGENLGGWRWYAEDIAAPSLPVLARQSGLKVAMLQWSVSVGAAVDFLVPEFWRAHTDDDEKLIRALSTPGVFERTVRRFPDFWQRYQASTLDGATTDIAVELIEKDKPNLLFMHIWQVDDAQHEHGLGSPQANAAIENADQQLKRVLEALARAGIDKKSVLVVLSDHGFRSYEKVVRPGVILRKAGLVTPTGKDKPKLSAWKAVASTNGGSAFIYLHDPKEAAIAKKVEELFRSRARDPKKSGIERVFSAEEIAARGGDPWAFLALEAGPGFSFDSSYDGKETEKRKGATHGWDPARPEMKASFLAYGPMLKKTTLESGGLVDVAPTIAGWLGVVMPGPLDGKPLPISLGSR